jgi:acetylornithine deacetylase/succinyl-diaminopimelate desuccinylase-like protein
MAHMDVVEARREDWSTDPFKLVEQDGYYYGRGTSDIKQGITAVTTALLQLRASGFRPTRDVVILFTGDEETSGNGAELGATEWKKWTDSEFALNSDGGGGGFAPDGRPLGFALQTAEKTYSMYTFTARNRGGHSSKPRPDNAIYQLAHAIERTRGLSLRTSPERDHPGLFLGASEGRARASWRRDARLAGQSQ